MEVVDDGRASANWPAQAVRPFALQLGHLVLRHKEDRNLYTFQAPRKPKVKISYSQATQILELVHGPSVDKRATIGHKLPDRSHALRNKIRFHTRPP